MPLTYKAKRRMWMAAASTLIFGKFESALGQAFFGVSEIFRHLEKVWDVKTSSAPEIAVYSLVLSCSAYVNSRNRGTIIWNLCVPPEQDPNEIPEDPDHHPLLLEDPDHHSFLLKENTHEPLKGKFPNKIGVTFSKKQLDPRSDDLFTALKTTRKEVAEFFAGLSSDPIMREQLASEIQHTFETNELFSLEEKSSAITQNEIKEAAEKQLSLTIIAIKSAYPTWQTLEGESLLEQVERFIPLLQNEKNLLLLNTITNQLGDLVAAENALKKYYQTQAALEIYLAALKTHLPLSYTATKLYTEKKGISLYEWTKPDSGLSTLALFKYHEINDNRQFLHIIHDDDFSHFNLLSIHRTATQQNIRVALQKTLTAFAAISACFASANGFLGGVKWNQLIWFCLKYLLFLAELVTLDTVGNSIDDIDTITTIIIMSVFGTLATVSSFVSNISWNYKNSAENIKIFADAITDPNYSTAEKRAHAREYRRTLAYVGVNILTTPCFAYFTTSKTFELIGLTGPAASTLAFLSTITVFTTNAINAISSVQKRLRPAPKIKRGLATLPKLDKLDYNISSAIGAEDSFATGSIYWVAVVHFFERFDVDPKDIFVNAFALLALASMCIYNQSFNIRWALIAIFMEKYPHLFKELPSDSELTSIVVTPSLSSSTPSMQMASLPTHHDISDEKTTLIGGARSRSDSHTEETITYVEKENTFSTNGHIHFPSLKVQISSITTEEQKSQTKATTPVTTPKHSSRGLECSTPVISMSTRTLVSSHRRNSVFHQPMQEEEARARLQKWKLEREENIARAATEKERIGYAFSDYKQ